MRIGIDLGGTKLEILCIDDQGKQLLRKRVPSPQGNYEKTVQTIRDLVLEVEQEINQTGTVGIGIPGTISKRTNLVKNANSTWLIGHPFKNDLSASLNREIRMANDANCFALSEATDGAAKGFETVFGVILGTGVGGGLVINNHIIGGVNGVAGEWGHNHLPWATHQDYPPAQCYCGLTGCIETFLSGPAISREIYKKYDIQIETKDIAKLQTDIQNEILSIYENRLARALASVINIFDPDVIVLGGGVSNIDRLYSNVPQLWDQWVFSDYTETKLLKAQHGDSSGVRGAAWLWPSQ